MDHRVHATARALVLCSEQETPRVFLVFAACLPYCAPRLPEGVLAAFPEHRTGESTQPIRIRPDRPSPAEQARRRAERRLTELHLRARTTPPPARAGRHRRDPGR
jgi:hypothetical protein